MASKSLLLVDAEEAPRAALAERLAGLGHRVEQTDRGAAALEQIAGCDLLLIGGAAGDMDELALCRAWRRAGGGAVLALAPDAKTESALAAIGAATLAKPVRLAELGRAIEAALRKSAPAPLALGRLRFHPATRELDCGAGIHVRLTEKEAAILVYLQGAEGRAVPRDELLGQVWGYAGAVTTHTLETHVYRLRRKLAAGAADAPELVSEGGGYRLVVSG